MKLVLISVGLLALAFAGIAIKIWAKKGGAFAGTCASSLINDGEESCSFCGARPDESCKKEEFTV